MEEVCLSRHADGMELALASQLSELSKGAAACLVTPINGYSQAVIDMLRYFTEGRKEYGIFVSTTKSYKLLKHDLEQRGIDTGKLIVFDMMSAANSPDCTEANCQSMPMPGPLAALSMAILQQSQRKNAKFVLFDSVDSFLIYDDTAAVEKFFDYLLARLKDSGVSGLGLSLTTMYPDERLDGIYRLFDKKIELK